MIVCLTYQILVARYEQVLEAGLEEGVTVEAEETGITRPDT